MLFEKIYRYIIGQEYIIRHQYTNTINFKTIRYDMAIIQCVYNVKKN